MAKKKQHFHPHALSRKTFLRVTFWTLAMGAMVVTGAAGVGRAAKNFRAALTEKPDIAIYILLKDEGLGNTTLLRETETERDYLAETKDGPKLVKLKKGEFEWYVALVEPLRE